MHRVDVVEPFEAVLVALVNAVDADEPSASLGGRGAAFGDGSGLTLGLGPVKPLGPVAGLSAQVVQVRHRQTRQALVACIAVERIGALHDLLGGRSREGAMQCIGLGQQGHIGGAELAGKAVGGTAVALG